MTLPVDPAKYAAFLVAMFVMAITPGPANLFAIATGMRRGKAAALVSVVGMNTASLSWFIAAGLGLAALIAAFPQFFHLLAIGGAVYVAWLGLKSILSGVGKDDPPHSAEVHVGQSAFRDGFMVQATNPKVLVFFTAVLPPFLDPARPMAAQLAMFAATAIGMDLISMSAYGLGGAALAARMTEPRFRRGFAVFVGLLLIITAVLILTKA